MPMRKTACKTSAQLVVLCVLALHLFVAPMIGLSVDEAHYGLYARFLDWSYFDHPPMVGWLLWLMTPLGLNEFTLRLPSAAIYVACSALLYHISATRLPGGTPKKGLLTVVVFSVCPIVLLLGFGLVPEFPLLLWSLLIALVAERLNPRSPLRDWLALGLLLGLAGLSKYTAVLLVLSLGLYWLLNKSLLENLRSARLYLAALLTLVLVFPVLWWNYPHDWASFAYQIDHAAGGEWAWMDVLRALLVQLLTYSPLLVIGGFIALRDVVKPGMPGLLACLALPVIALVVVGSGNGASLPHWSLLGWSLLAPSVSHWVIDNWQIRRVRWLASIGTGMSLGISILGLSILAFKPMGSMPWAAPGLKDLVGWREAAQRAALLVEEQHPQEGVILVRNWSRASRIAWYAWPDTVQVLASRSGQYAYWYGEVSNQTRGILIRDDLDEDDKPTSPYKKDGLYCLFIEDYPVRVDSIEINRFYFYSCSGTTLD